MPGHHDEDQDSEAAHRQREVAPHGRPGHAQRAVGQPKGGKGESDDRDGYPPGLSGHFELSWIGYAIADMTAAVRVVF